ncbi:MAG TPA: cysteine--tRNA ligase [Candidatus Ornithocaccomicrobium faecavium]|uniref:Cysteine--tRNA ligase n=1 Tax=Candidatus Ornithocaccomicrobium faecavium TaxID=2840890 RepID=A0A9D1TDH3_9FIRM|nr:cysteine--tRNA ligase [Clostridiales bacterium]HIV27837.1 cysteine--tRNA ligase [Candidatus Ornithocaccomicrobium faecavium]
MKIYNTMTRKKEEFVPLHEGKVGIYSCGPTVYNYFHIGNARPFIIFDTLRRHLEHMGYEVTFVQNFTDVDDKMIRRANEEGVTVAELGDRFIEEYFRDADALGVKRATVHPRATKHIGEIIGMIKKLEAKGLAYEVDGDVYYDTHAFPGYGKLSGQNLEDREMGARIEVDEDKKHPMDFALWKKQKPGEPAWKSPWGMGRPGWHIECSAMSCKYLGQTFDIHCGGVDLIFPHHENEIAQSEGANGQPFARYWMHNGHINVDNHKMSKSAGNFFTVRDIVKEFDPEAVRLFMLSAHYRSPINFSRDLIEQAQNALARLYTARDNALFLRESAPDCPMTAEEEAFAARADQAISAFNAAMDDDLNTADALGVIFEYVRDMNASLNEHSSRAAVEKGVNALNEMAGVLGLLRREADLVPEDVKALVEERQAAKKARDFAQADALRAQIEQMGYVVEDTPKGPKVRKA